MGLFSFLKKNTEAELPLEKVVRQLKFKEVNYVYEDISEVESKLKASDKALLSLTPVNYYALKSKYLKAVYYTDSDYQENYIRFYSVESKKNTDHIIAKTAIYPISREVLVKAYAKVGIIIN